MLAATILNAAQILLIVLPLCVNACVRNGFGLRFVVYEETEVLKFRDVETIHINHLIGAADLRTFPILVESPKCRARQ